MTLRKTFFWLHLLCGVSAGIVMLIMSVTGVLLTYEKQMLVWADRRQYEYTPPQENAQRLPMSLLLARAREARGDAPSAITVRSDPAHALMFAYGREGAVFVDPYSGEVLGEGGTAIRSFFRTMTDWHRWLGQPGKNRDAMRAITGASNLAFLFIVCSGIYIWWPRNWKWATVKNVVLFRGGLTSKARDFNWHNVIGFWSFLPLFWVVLSATIISYPWASNLVYQLAGEEAPVRGGGAAAKGGPGPQRGGPGGAAKAAAERPSSGGQASGAEAQSTAEGAGRGRQGDGATAEGPSREGRRGEDPRDARTPGGNADPPAGLQLEGIDALLARAARQVDGWRTITLRLPVPVEGPVSFLIDRSYGGEPQSRSTLELDRGTGEVVQFATFADNSLGQRLRSYLRFIHTGEAGGFWGQTVAGLVSLGGCFLVYTGLALAWRRFWAWRGRRADSVNSAAEQRTIGVARVEEVEESRTLASKNR